ncbi:hypothetical protein H4J59_16385 [Colwellia sp. MB02u-10]|uniref:hypothetical protein n=1 Tax=Colwellia sp. MB02u-10 TaxID=2759828 RepID=UPI0015F524CE|nr:hypothetical protein [Colwellia sp. MB02u-10]MBA6342572.1 hypothetical protein [Colwellia sp. MB02u-10]
MIQPYYKRGVLGWVLPYQLLYGCFNHKFDSLEHSDNTQPLDVIQPKKNAVALYEQ